MKHKKFLTAVVLAATALLVAACSSTPVQGVEDISMPKENNVDVDAMPKVVLDWSDRAMAQESSPVWLKLLRFNGNSSAVRTAFNIPADSIVKCSLAQRANREEARVLAGLYFAQEIAQDLKNYVVTAAAQNLNQGQMDIVEEITTATKVTITGAERVADFWQLVEDEDPGTKMKSREYLYYVVWAMPADTWNALTRKYVNDVIGKIPDRAVQTQIANAYDDIERKAAREEALSDAEAQRKIDLQYQAAENLQKQEMAKIESQTATNAAIAGAAAAQAGAEQERLSTARYAAYRSGDSAIAAAASMTAADFDWINALKTASEVNR